MKQWKHLNVPKYSKFLKTNLLRNKTLILDPIVSLCCVPSPVWYCPAKPSFACSNLMLLQINLPHIYVGGKMVVNRYWRSSTPMHSSAVKSDTLSIGFIRIKTIAAVYATSTSLSSASALSRYCSSTQRSN